MSEAINYEVEYDNSARVENSDALVDEFITKAADFREATAETAQLNVIYGSQDRNQMDIFWPDGKRDSPIVMFVHGGYWQRLDRTAFSHMAKGLNENGIAVAIPSYTLCPDTTVGNIINEIRRACIMLHQTHGKELTVVGHSAGGHLAACMMATDWPDIHRDLPSDLVASGLGISGIYDLIPLLQTPINNALGLDEETARSASPIHWLPDGLHRFEAWVGSDESSEFHRQGRELVERWNMLGTSTRYVSMKGLNHFTAIHPLCNPDSTLVQRIMKLQETPSTNPKLPKPDAKEVKAAMKNFRTAASESKPKEEAKPDESDAAVPENVEASNEV